MNDKKIKPIYFTKESWDMQQFQNDRRRRYKSKVPKVLAIKKTKYLIYRKKIKTTCCICLEPINKIDKWETTYSKSYSTVNKMSKNDNLTLICNHKFHYKCILEWLKENNTCPICRMIV